MTGGKGILRYNRRGRSDFLSKKRGGLHVREGKEFRLHSQSPGAAERMRASLGLQKKNQAKLKCRGEEVSNSWEETSIGRKRAEIGLN